MFSGGFMGFNGNFIDMDVSENGGSPKWMV